ncbi:DUF5131 family protein [Streptomyces sp. V1I6]|uniref:DUF5131 family protein n=1 Tax=Streptomyces sp. V1I6 TaxID=3042273 RepID=UPI002782D4D2|nr:phage Gp37/Gp68 family protein [Streptomyces sp. V1I6]MDQ0842458.1 protein gp37 [Streptomyces sp. V1I6]
MSTDTKIEWTDRTWNPVTGCTKVSPGCDNCYAENIANRFAGSAAFPRGFDVQVRANKVNDPLSWRKPSRVFVNSMSDLFHNDVPEPWLADIFAVMAAAQKHTFQVLTKRHGRMRSLMNSKEFQSQVRDRATGKGLAIEEFSWPLPNVWLGVSVEDQKRADLRIPALVDTPAAVRFLSCEPLLGPVDLSKWMPPISPMPAADAPRTWAEWTWPDWVPQIVREHVEDFWGADQGRSPAHWIRDMHQQGAPAFGATLAMDDGFGRHPRQIVGRYVHAWNNIGRLVLDGDPDREFAYTSFGIKDRKRTQPIDWVIVGGESGRGARPMHPAWARGLRDQCTAADVSFFFKQWGEWGPAPFQVRVCDPNVGWQGTDEELAAAKADSEARGATHVHTGNWFEEDGERRYWLHEIGHKPWSLERVGLPEGTAAIRRWGKKAAGRDLDGRTWDQYPKPQAA